MQKRQTQLMLIVDNVNLPMPGRASLYEEVVKSWTGGMIMADRLISGMAQSASSVDALVGLCAWHIYPDLCAIGLKTTLVEQQDEVVEKGGLLTIGLSSVHNNDPMGISWSLPLSHLRYYGRAETSQTMIGSSNSRKPFARIVQIAMGSIMSAWESPHAEPTNLAKFLISFEKCLQNATGSLMSNRKQLSPRVLDALMKVLEHLASSDESSESFSPQCWPSLMSRHAQSYLNADESEKSEMNRYMALGRRRYALFLAKSEEHPSPYFGLCDTNVYLQIIEVEQRIDALRDMTKLFTGFDGLENAIIRIVHTMDVLGSTMVEIASLFPQTIPGTSRATHRRWIVLPESADGSADSSAIVQSQQDHAFRRSVEIMIKFAEPCGFLRASCIQYTSQSQTSRWPSGFMWHNKEDPVTLECLMEQSSWADDALPPSQRLLGWRMGHLNHLYGGIQYQSLYGCNTYAAVFLPSTKRRPSDLSLPGDYVADRLGSDQIDQCAFIDFVAQFTITSDHASTSMDYFMSLRSIALAQNVYEMLPQAEVDLSIISRPLCHSKWARAALQRQEMTSEAAISLSCVCWFDTGHIDLDTGDLKDVLAVSSANSIYALEFLFRDPLHKSRNQRICHVIGNVGKPGLALLLSPRNTLLREPDLETWQLVNHAPFDGKLEDNFSSTSLHLSLTGYEQQLNIPKQQGARDREAYYLEAVVSAFDKGAWVADLDLFHLLHGHFTYISPRPMCRWHNGADAHTTSSFSALTSVDNWFEYLDRPPNSAVIRAHGNWVARLALAAIPLTDKDPLVVLGSDKICWTCVEASLREEGHSMDERLFLC